jgi:(1->4)-alpha-D-glucan 1-alpha-D-glucosylmutase
MLPRATYRLQLNRHFRFDDAAAIVPYLARLGISHVYCSPYLRAHPGSMHGYDVVDHNAFNPEIGSREDFENFVKVLRAHDMGHIADIVPNHAGIGSDNVWWMDVLQNGEASQYAGYFDIDWSAGKLIIPVLGESYGRALSNGDLQLRPDPSWEFVVGYHEHVFPIAKQHVAQAVQMLEAGDTDRTELLHELLERQAYRLAHWRVAADAINYRRFFDVNTLAALRMESADVFNRSHRLILELVRDGWIDGLRIDHIDGLFDPAGYLARLRAATAERSGPPVYLWIEKITAAFERLPLSWPVQGTTGYAFATVVNGLFIRPGARQRMQRVYEHFIGSGASWEEVMYDSKGNVLEAAFGSELRVLVQRLAAIAAADRDTRDFTVRSLEAAVREVIACFPVYRTYVVEQASEADRRFINWAITQAKLRVSGVDEMVFEFLRGLLLNEQRAESPQLQQARHQFTMRFQQLTAPATAKGVEDTAMYRFNRLTSLNEVGGDPGRFGVRISAFHAEMRARQRRLPLELLATSTHDTKRSEDVRARIDVLSEFPAMWNRVVNRWRRLNRSRKRRVEGQWAPGPNQEYLLYQTLLGTWPMQPMDAEALQIYKGRIQAYMLKAVREAKLRTSWANVRANYEAALQEFIDAVLDDGERNPFIADMHAVLRYIGRLGLVNGLSQTVCKLTAPGVPDIYQGTEVWDYSLVDPDNRRAVDYSQRAKVLAALERLGEPSTQLAEDLVRTLEDGRAKLFLIRTILAFRHRYPRLFSDGGYLPATASGARQRHVCAFLRRLPKPVTATLTVFPRLCGRLSLAVPLSPELWGDTVIEIPRNLASERWFNVLDGTPIEVLTAEARRVIRVRDVLAHFPVAMVSTGAHPRTPDP